MAEGKVLFIVNIPPDFTRKLILRGLRPQISIEGDASDPLVVAANERQCRN
ncbi:hypothetical protein [Coxiella-like endosymbiont]|uniref:hypothetical protein n=1 Tax=Coxiella-like endosymbiont TaxID=1592897 RepID=UPI00272BEC11|nr:hypothetical protein [Coxiella-like endosymbiont]